MIRYFEDSKEAIKLFKGGLNQKQIAKKMGHSEKTISKWLKEFKKSRIDLDNRIELLNNRLDELIASKNSDSVEIENITKALLNLKNIKKLDC